jgi:hypothetical protein
VARVSQVIVLAEDERQQRFVRYYLRKLSYTTHDIRLEPLPAGRGSGEASVRTRYSPAVKAYRARSARAQTSLVVAIDADTGDIAHRAGQLEERLVSEGQSLRTGEERIIHLIPRRNIETWILNLNGNSVDEDTDFRHAPAVDHLIDSAAKTFFEWTRPNAAIPAFCVPSLRFAIPEIRRLEHRP